MHSTENPGKLSAGKSDGKEGSENGFAELPLKGS